MTVRNFAWGEREQRPRPALLERPEETPTKAAPRLRLEPLEPRDTPNVAWGE